MKKLLAALIIVFSTSANADIIPVSSMYRVTSPDTITSWLGQYCEEYLQVMDSATGMIYMQRDCLGTPRNDLYLTPVAQTLFNKTSMAAIASTIFTGTSSQYVRGDGVVANFPSSPSFSVGYPSSRSITLATAYQCTNTAKPCQIVINVRCPLTLSLLVGATCEGEIRVGSSNTVATGGGANIAPIYRNASGIIGLSTNDIETKTISIPAGGYFAVRQTTGAVNIVSVFEQVIGN